MTPASSVAKPKRRAKAFALALLPLALALTACGGSSDGDSTQAPPPSIDTDDLADKIANRLKQEPEENPYGEYEKHFGVLQELANKKINIFELMPKEGDFRPSAGLRLTLSALMNLDKFRELKAAYYATFDPNSGDTKLSSYQREQYEKLIKSVRDLAIEGYQGRFLLDETIANNWYNYDLDLDTVGGNYGVDPMKTLRPYGTYGNGLAEVYHRTASGLEPKKWTSAIEQAELDARYISTSALSIRSNLDRKRALNAEDIEQGLLTAVKRKYRKTDGTLDNDVWGDVDLSSLRGDVDTVKEFENEFENVLVGWVDKGSGRTPFAQLSFYHANDYNKTDKSNNTIGIDFVHMEDVSFFLYYYADTERKVSQASMGRDEFMVDFDKNGKVNTWSIAGIVEGADPTDGKGYKDNDYSYPIDHMDGSLSYQGIMLAGSIEQTSVASTGIKTYMGDANVTLNLNPNKLEAHSLDIEFKNILLTNEYLAGKTSDDMIVFKDIDVIQETTDTYFGGTNGTTNRAEGHVYGRFYGKEVGVSSEQNSNYGGRNAVGGTFYGNLTDENGNQVGDRLFEGVFGATATGAPPATTGG